MKEINVNGQKRTDTGKKASKLLRKEGLVPAICMVRRRVRTVCPRHWLSQHLLLNCVRLSIPHTYM